MTIGAVEITSNPSLILTSGASGRINALFSVRALRSLIAVVNAFLLILLVPFRCRKRTVVISSGEKMMTVIKEEKQESSVRKSAVVRVPATIVPWRSSVKGIEQDVASRRALAIRRVMQDDDENTVRQYSLVRSPRGDTLFAQSWTSVSVKVRGVVVLLHGLNEHSGRYGGFAKQLNASGFKVYGIDWIGHGGSDGLHAYIHSLDDAVNDLKSYLEKVFVDNPGLPCFCFGHSTGGAIVLKAMLDPKIECRVAGVVLTSPAVGVQPSHPIYKDKKDATSMM